MGIPRPRDDKAATIRRMLDFSESKLSCTDVQKSEPNELNLGDDSIKMSSSGISSSEYKQDSSSKNECSATDRRLHSAKWICNLPPSLKGLYEKQKNLGPKQSHSVLSCTTSPLREVVVQMHNRVGAVIKFIPA